MKRRLIVAYFVLVAVLVVWVLSLLVKDDEKPRTSGADGQTMRAFVIAYADTLAIPIDPQTVNEMTTLTCAPSSVYRVWNRAMVQGNRQSAALILAAHAAKCPNDVQDLAIAIHNLDG